MVRNMIKKDKQKNSLRLRRRIRKTLGALSLASSLVVAAIPVDTLQAVENLPGDVEKVILTEADSMIPEITASTPLYVTGDGVYEFAYVYPKGILDGDKIAVITSYNGNVDTNLTSGTLDIPNKMDAYKHYDPGTGTGSGYVAVNSKDQYMFYKLSEPVLDEYGNYTYGKYVQQVDENGDPVVDANGDPVMVPDETTLIKSDSVYPCFYKTISEWGSIADKDLCVLRSGAAFGSKDAADYIKVEGPDDWRLSGVLTQYINNGGVFADLGSIVTVKIGDNMRGIGDNSFYGCTSIQEVTLGAGLDTIGNYAFANCINMKAVNIPSNTNVRIIGEHAFSNCQNLLSYVNPLSVEKIGDYCFENCYNLEEVRLDGGENIPNLKNLGNHLFVNCRSLEKLVIPYNVMETLDISMLEGCTSLKSVTIKNEQTSFTDGLPSVNNGGAYSIEAFKASVAEEFYFEGIDGSEIQEVCAQHAIAFKYMDENIYEIIIHEVLGDLTSPKAIYRVTGDNQLILCALDKGIKVVDMPDTIGPATIKEISSTSFQNNCYLEKVYIPSSVQTINDSAFQGCHNLEHVVFRDPVNVQSIGANAFQTQKVAVHNSQCDGKLEAENPKLTFTGPVSDTSVPFLYAMDPDNNINVGSQYKTYITYYSGWPSNLTVRYNPTTDKNELIDYPTFADLTSYATMPYVTEEEVKALTTVLNSQQSGQKLTQNEEEIIDSVLELELPRGIESVKEDLFVVKEGQEINLSTFGRNKTIITQSIEEILPYTFEGCSNVESIYINGSTYSIGDYAFKDCDKLKNVEISSTVSSLGLRPFAGCGLLSDVSFQGGSYFTCDDCIIYGLENGDKVSIIECLESRGVKSGSSTINASEVVGVKTIAEEAFMDCDGIGSVMLTQSTIGDIPESAFKDTDILNSVYLPNTCKAIWGDAFANSKVRYLEIPSSVSYIDPDAFYTNKNHPDECFNITFYCEDNSNAKVYADIYDNIMTTTMVPEITYEVYFMAMDGTVLDKQTVVEGADAVPPEAPELDGYIFKGWAPSYQAISGNLNIVAQYEPIDPDSLRVTVQFIDYDETVLKTERVDIGGTATPPTVADREGYRFVGWIPAITNITKDTDIYAQYEKMDSDEFKCNVTFVDYDDTVLKVERVDIGSDAQPPNNPEREGYLFTGWRPSYKSVTGDTTVYAQYEKVDSEETKYIVRFIDFDDTVLYVQKVEPGEDAITPQAPTREGYTFTGWRPAITAINKDLDTYAQYEKIEPTPAPATPEPTPAPTTTPETYPTPEPTPAPTPVVFYTLTVRNGSGSGSYPAGERVIIIADDPASGQEFSNWTVDPTDAVLASKYVTATVIDMPAKDVLVTANYKSKASSGVVSGSNNSSGNSGGSAGTVGGNSGSTSTSTNGTTVVINKNGLSNTGVVAVQVHGSSDNFVLKVSENSTATEAVLKALMAKYSELRSILYFPMDLVLYDETGTIALTDTTGLSINITLPIPDSMITYAGNNKVAAIVDGKLKELPVTFKTISGVSCVSFTTTYFGPHVIYVDTDNLNAGVIIDTTPKTGDGIHPKWFLSVGLLCVSMVLFLKKDKQTKTDSKKVKMA